MQSLRALIFLTLACALTACVVARPQEGVQTRTITPAEAVSIFNKPTAANEAALKKKDGRLSILAISGGGTDGAYGAGVLSGWTKAGTRPQFDVVTGVSTGALMSIWAFLGPQYDDLLKQLYVGQSASSIYASRGLKVLVSDSVLDNTPLKKQIEKLVTPRILDAIATEHLKGRRLYVATTNIDANVPVIWDMGLIASGGAEGRADRVQHFQKILRASSALPVLFSPVYIKPLRGVQLRQAHVDGGIKTPVILNDFLFEENSAGRDLYVIVNGSLGLKDGYKPVTASIPNIGTAAISGLTRELMQQTLYRGYVRAQNTRTNFQLTAIPDSVEANPNPLRFDSVYLNNIYDIGFRSAQRPNFWWKEPPTLRNFDRVSKR